MTDKPDDKKPPRGYSWPPFEKGNLVRLKHGAHSETVIAQTMMQMLPGVIERAPWLSDEMYDDERGRYLRAAARERLMSEYIFEVIEEKGVGAVPSRLFEQVTAAARLASQLANGLGLTPRGFVEIHHIIASTRRPERTLQEIIENGRLVNERAQERRLAHKQAEQSSAPVGELGPPDVPGDDASPAAAESEPDPDDPGDAS